MEFDDVFDAEQFGDAPIRPHTELLVRYVLRRLDVKTQSKLEYALVQDSKSRKLLLDVWRVVRVLATNPLDEFKNDHERLIAQYWRKWTGPVVLPRWETPFVGRDSEVEQLIELLKNNPLVTVAGQAGMGKTRLACEVALQQFETFRDGVYYFSCSFYQRSEDFLSSLAQCLGLEADATLEEIQANVASRRMLIVVDSCEKLPGISVLIEALISAAPRVRWIATSHSILGIRQEKCLELLPDPGLITILVSRLHRLFGEFHLSAEHRAVLAGVCKKLGCIPLNLSIAAGCLHPSLGIEEGIRALERLSQPQAERQSSVGELGPIPLVVLDEERDLLLQLLSFAGWFTEEDAAPVLGVPPEGVALFLQSLASGERLDSGFDGLKYVYKVPDPVADNLQRTNLLPSERALVAKGQSAHADYYLAVGQQIGSLFDKGDWHDGTSKLQQHRLNLRKAVNYLTQEGRHSEISGLYVALSRPLLEAGYLTDFEILGEATRIASEKLQDRALKASLLGLQGALASRRSDDESARRLWKERLEICKELGDTEKSADALIDLAWEAYENLGIAPALIYLEEAEKLVQEANLTELAATVWVIRARMLIDSGNKKEGLQWVQRTNEMIAISKNQDPLLFVYQNLVRAYQHSSMPEQALDTLKKLLRVSVDGDRAVHIGWTLQELGSIYEQQGDLELAEQCYVLAARVYKEYRTRHANRAQASLEAFAEKHGRNWKEAIERWSTTSIDALL